MFSSRSSGRDAAARERLYGDKSGTWQQRVADRADDPDDEYDEDDAWRDGPVAS
jgi:hypothetical protein